jgi:hypothetical protein
MSDPEYGLWEACPNDAILAMGIDGVLEENVFHPVDGHESWRGNPDQIRAFRVEWADWVSERVEEKILELALADELHGSTTVFVLYEDESNATKVVASQRGEPGVLYLIAYKV